MIVKNPRCVEIRHGQKTILLDPEEARELFKRLARTLPLRPEVGTHGAAITLEIHPGVGVRMNESEALEIAQQLIDAVRQNKEIPF